MKEKTRIFSFNFDLKKAQKLREVVNEKVNISIEKQHELGDKHIPYMAWDRMCAIMDRLEDTLLYLNSITIGNCISRRSAFDFFNFVNNEYIVIDCIKTMGKIFGVESEKFKAIESSNDVFGDVLEVGGTDDQFFKYIRSLCAVHPINTTQKGGHPYLKDAKLHCCPFVVWANDGVGTLWSDDRDLSVHIYVSDPEEGTIMLPLYVKQFVAYLNRWICFIPDIVNAIYNYFEMVYESHRNNILKSMNEFCQTIDYLEYLRSQDVIRFNSGDEYIYDQFIDIFKINLSNQENQKKLEKYKKAISYSLTFRHNLLQSMITEGYESTGIIECDVNNDLFNLLYFPKYNEDDFPNCGYHFSKLSYLDGDYGFGDEQYARFLLEEIKDNLNKYVIFTNEESNKETIVLVHLALYLSALTYDNLLNNNIPKTNDFRCIED